uniref:Uncharacterized protein n=1 Tax=Poecilia reticulata TaxID=8081 RepID=A0A3P9Q475_POERE
MSATVFTGSPSSSAGLCRPARSRGKAGRSRGPAAPSCSSKCFQTGERRRRRGLVKTRTPIPSRCTLSL